MSNTSAPFYKEVFEQDSASIVLPHTTLLNFIDFTRCGDSGFCAARSSVKYSLHEADASRTKRV